MFNALRCVIERATAIGPEATRKTIHDSRNKI